MTAEVYELIDYPAKGFALELNSVNQLDRVADNVYKGLSIINDLDPFKIPIQTGSGLAKHRGMLGIRPIHLLSAKVCLFLKQCLHNLYFM